MIASHLPAWPQDSLNAPVSGTSLFLTRLGGPTIAPPDDSRHYLGPRGAVDASGRLHLVWGESSIAPSDPPLHGYLTDTAVTLWHSVWSNGSWTSPKLILPRAEGGGRDANVLGWLRQGNVVVDGAGAVHVFAMDRTSGQLIWIREEGGRWQKMNLPAHQVGYMHAAADSKSLYLVLVGQLDDAAGPADDIVLLKLVLSNGAWSGPVRVGTLPGLRAYEPRIVVASSGEVNVLWRQELNLGSDVMGIAHALSLDQGMSWSAPSMLSIPHQRYDVDLRAATDVCGVVHVAFRSSGGVSYAASRDGRWVSRRTLSTGEGREIAMTSTPSGVVIYWEEVQRSPGVSTQIEFVPSVMRSRIKSRQKRLRPRRHNY